MQAQEARLRDIITEAAEARVPINFMYTKLAFRGGPELRVVVPDADEPIRTAANGHDYLVGRDIQRNEPRQFRVERIGPATTVLPPKAIPERILQSA